jgi:hypothetical protein
METLIKDNFFGWFTGTYHTYPIALYINLLELSDWNLFQPEREQELVDDVYMKEGYKDYFSMKEFMECIKIMRLYLHSQGYTFTT